MAFFSGWFGSNDNDNEIIEEEETEDLYPSCNTHCDFCNKITDDLQVLENNKLCDTCYSKNTTPSQYACAYCDGTTLDVTSMLCGDCKDMKYQLSINSWKTDDEEYQYEALKKASKYSGGRFAIKQS